MKKIYLIPIFFFALSFNAAAASFPDVAKDHKNFKAIDYLAEKNVIKGYSDNTFGPDKLVNRAEAVKIISVALGVKTDDKYEMLFPDVKKTDWFFNFVMGGKAAGIIGGYKDNTFKPGDPVNLAETMKILSLAAKVKLPAKITEDVFTDVGKSAWYAPHMQYGRDHNLMLADDYGAVHPDQAMTRGAFAEFVYRMMIVKEKKEEPFPLALNWKIYNSGAFPFSMKYDDKSWKVIEDKSQVVFLKPDKQYSQFSAGRIYPNTGVVTVVVDPNIGNMVKDQYFTNIKNAFPGGNYKKFKIGELSAYEVIRETDHMTDWYVYLKNNQVLIVYTQYGNGVLKYQLNKIIKAMLDTLEYREVSVANDNYAELLNKIMATVLVKNKGMESLNILPEKLIIQTDALGAGNGPVDYYYSQKVNYTFKYERTDDVILDTREGKTTAF